MPKRFSQFTLDAVETYRLVADAQIHPDASCVAFVVGALTHPQGKNPRHNIYLTGMDAGSTRPFTTADACEVHPRWSPDGARLAFASDRVKNDVFQLYLLARDGGEAEQLTFAHGIQAPYRDVGFFKWSPDGTQIAYLQQDPEDAERAARRERGYDEIEFEARPRFTRVWVLNVATRVTRVVTRGDVQVWELEWSPDGKELALVCSALPYEWSWYETFLARVPIRGGVPRKVLKNPGKQLAHPHWSPDGHHLAYISMAMSDRGIVSGDVYVTDTGGKHPRSISEGYEGSLSGIEWLDPHTLIGTGYFQGEAVIAQFDVEGEAHNLWHASFALQESFTPKFSRARDGTLAVVRSGPGAPREVWTLDLRDPEAAVWQQLTQLNAGFEEAAVGEQQVVRWTSVDGRAMQGILVLPPGAKKGQAVPMVVYPHGGPTGITANEFFTPIRWVYHLARRGFGVFMPNYRGSTGWGVEFAEANLGDMGGLDFQDIMTGVDALVERGLADPKRLGFGGWSYGGFLTAWAITQTDRFKAAVAGAAVTNWLSFHGTSYLSAWDALYMQQDPYESGGLYDRSSPMRHIRNARTPTLVLHGEKDGDVPVSQGYELYTALRELGVETEMVIYPREPHAVTETAHVKDIIIRVCDWFERHLK